MPPGYFSFNATSSQTQNNIRSSGLSNANEMLTAINRFGKEIITSIYIDLVGLYGYNSFIQNTSLGSSVDSYLISIDTGKHGIVYKTELICLKQLIDYDGNINDIGLRTSSTNYISSSSMSSGNLQSVNSVLNNNDKLYLSTSYTYSTEQQITQGKFLIKLYGADI